MQRKIVGVMRPLSGASPFAAACVVEVDAEGAYWRREGTERLTQEEWDGLCAGGHAHKLAEAVDVVSERTEGWLLRPNFAERMAMLEALRRLDREEGLVLSEQRDPATDVFTVVLQGEGVELANAARAQWFEHAFAESEMEAAGGRWASALVYAQQAFALEKTATPATWALMAACYAKVGRTFRADGYAAVAQRSYGDAFAAEYQRLFDARMVVDPVSVAVPRSPPVSVQVDVTIAPSAIAEGVEAARAARVNTFEPLAPTPASGFMGVRGKVLAEVHDGAHTVRFTEYHFAACGSVLPYVEMHESHDGSRGGRVMCVSALVHLAQNLSDDEVFAIGNRESAPTNAVSAWTTRCTRRSLVDSVDGAIRLEVAPYATREMGRRELVRTWVEGESPSRCRRWLAAATSFAVEKLSGAWPKRSES